VIDTELYRVIDHQQTLAHLVHVTNS